MMDPRFLEFIGNLFINAARSQTQLEEMTKWFRGGAASSDGLAEMFRQTYRLTPGGEGSRAAEADPLPAVMKDFQTAYEGWLQMVGAVPLSDYRRLEEERDALRKENEEQARMIRYLSGVVSGEGPVQSTTMKGLKELTENQTRQFGDLIRAFGEYLQDSTPASADSGKSDDRDVDDPLSPDPSEPTP
jgi:hypothetical protein